MKTQVITIGEKRSDCTYPVAVYFDDGTPGWRSTSRESGTIAFQHESCAACPAAPKAGAFCPACITKFVLDTPGSDPHFTAIGQYLWGLFETGGGRIAKQFKTYWDAHAKVALEDKKDGLRTILDIRAKELRAVPWELMIRSRVPLFGLPLNPVLRGRLDEAEAPPAHGLLLKVLVAVGTDDKAIAADQEITFLQDALRSLGRMVDLRVERPRSLKALLDSHNAFRPDVLHFIGHGVEVGGESLLEFKYADKTEWDWKESEIRESFALGPPRLAFLNACRTQKPEKRLATREAIGSLADAFLDANTLAVVAMQGEIDGQAAAEFSGSVYCALAAGQPIDVALAAARYKLRQNGDQKNRREWCLPSLMVRVAVDAVLPRQADAIHARRREIERTPEFAAIRAFVDRTDERRRLDPLTQQNAPPDLLIVWGPPKTGKTAMLHWVLEGCAWCDHQIKYVDLKNYGKPKLPTVLRAIQLVDHQWPSRLRQQLTGDFTRFGELAALLDDTGAALPAAIPALRPDHPMDALFGAFRKALVESAAGRPLIIALDHLGEMLPSDFATFLRPYLLDYVVQGRVDHIRIILGCTDDEYGTFELESLANLAQTVRIDNFERAEFPALLTEYLLHRNVPRERIPDWKSLTGPLTPERLRDTYKLLTGQV